MDFRSLHRNRQSACVVATLDIYECSLNDFDQIVFDLSFFIAHPCFVFLQAWESKKRS